MLRASVRVFRPPPGRIVTPGNGSARPGGPGAVTGSFRPSETAGYARVRPRTSATVRDRRVRPCPAANVRDRPCPTATVDVRP
ncbi:hypothetical protein B9S64_31445 [Streptomyces sp. SM18]|nr:hypothetical protein B9S64_31445 [Streptomyces sp. SM18]